MLHWGVYYALLEHCYAEQVRFSVLGLQPTFFMFSAFNLIALLENTYARLSYRR